MESLHALEGRGRGLLAGLRRQRLAESFTLQRLAAVLPLCDPDLVMYLFHLGFDHPGNYPAASLDGIGGHLIGFLQPLLAEQEDGMKGR